MNTNPLIFEKMTTQLAKAILLPALILCAATASTNGQTIKAFERAASKSAEHHDYYSAMKYVENALTIDSTRTDLLVRHAEFALLFGAPTLAEESYEKALQQDQSGQFVAAFRGLGEAERRLGKYDEAIGHFELFMNKSQSAPQADRDAVEQAISDCVWAKSVLATPAPEVVIERLNEDVNTTMADFAPVKKGDTLFYSSFREVDWKDKNYPKRPLVEVMESVKDAAPVASSFNEKERHTANTAFSPKGDLMVYTICDYVGPVDIRCQLYLRRLVNGKWSQAERLPDFINADSATTTQPSLCFGYEKDKLTLLFASDRKGGRGGMDIYTSAQEADGSWSKPVNLQAINTAGNDVTPFYNTESQVLYFSTDGRRTLGGYDIYRAQHNAFVGGPSSDDGAAYWDTPENLGLPFNSPGHDVYFTEEKGGEATFFASNRLGSVQVDKEACCFDIYKTKLLPLRLETLVFNKKDQSAIPGVNIRLVEDRGPSGSQQNTGDDNQADFQVDRNKRYMLIAEKDGFLPDTTFLMTNEVPANRTFRSKLFLDFKPKEEPKEGKLRVTPKWLEQFLPVTLYFDNDHPNPNTRATTTSLAYDETYVRYISRKDEFVRVFSRGMTGEQKIAAEAELSDFFENDVKKGYERLETFTSSKALKRFLDDGYTVEIIIEGYASPLAKSDYNQALTMRRSACVLNYLNQVEGGVYQQYTKNGQLTLRTVGFGEEKSRAGVNDNARDTRQSIYSPAASRERYAKILQVRVVQDGKEVH